VAVIDAAVVGNRATDTRSYGEHRDALKTSGSTNAHFGDERHAAIIFDDDPLTETCLHLFGEVDAGQVHNAAG
jgi:hypothetical protein